MPRIARKNLESTYFHVMVQGISKEDIFYKAEYKTQYIKLIYKYKSDFNVELLAFCIMNNHAHLLLHINSIKEMSEFMHKINTLYAMFYNQKFNNRVGHVFRNRFRSEAIKDNVYLSNCIRYIHNNPVKAKIVAHPKEYKYSSYNDFLYKKGLSLNSNLKMLVDLDYIVTNQEVDDIFIDIEKNSNEIIQKVIKENLRKQTREEKIKIINKLKNEYKIPYKESCKVLKVSERTFRREMDVLTSVPKTDKEENEV